MRIFFSIRLVFFITIATLIAVFSTQLLDYLPFIVGGVMILFGIEGILIPISKSPSKFFNDAQFFLGHIDLLLGIVMMCSIRQFDYICIVWGTWTIVRESFDLYEVVHKVYHKFPAILSFALSVIEIVFSVLLIIYASEHHALTHIYLLIPEFIVNGISPFLFFIHKNKRKKREQKQNN